MLFKNYAALAIVTLFTTAMLSACGDSASDQSVEEGSAVTADQTQMEEANTLATDGRIVVSSLPKENEPNACILPITIRNGTDVETTVSMMDFSVSGSGQDDGGNMFAQTVAPGETNTARLVFPTRQCEELSVITAPNLTCNTDGEDCAAAVEFEAVDGLIIQRGE